MNGFKDIGSGTFLNAWVRRIEKREGKDAEGQVVAKVIVYLLEEYHGDGFE